MNELEPTPKLDWRMLAYLFLTLVALGMGVAFCVAEPKHAYAQVPPVVVRVSNFGKPMQPVAPSFTNDPERIVYSQNFYSNQPGARQNRNGSVLGVNYASLTTSAADAIAHFESPNDSAAVVFMAGGRWWYSFYGSRTAGTMQYVSALAAPREVRPYSPGTVTIAEGTRLMDGAGTLFTRYIRAGDTLHVDSPSDTFVVRVVVSDILLIVDSVNNIGTHVTDSWQARRRYSGTDPYLYASDKYVYSGSVKDHPQVLFNKDDTVFIRPLVMVDSFFVDAITRLHYRDSSGGAELRRSYANAGNDTVIEEIQLVSRRANWLRDQWLTTSGGSPVSYFCRLGWWDTDNDQWGRFYTIRGNSDTSIYLASWYRDSLLTGIPVNVQLGRGDSMVTADVASSPWAYIYTAVGEYDVVIPDAQTDTATLFGRGAVWKIFDPGAPMIDTAEFYNNLYFLHLTQDDISFPAYTAGFTTIKNYVITRLLRSECAADQNAIEPPLTQDELPSTDVIIKYEELVFPICPKTFGRWHIKSTNPRLPVQAQFVNEAFYPVRNARRNADSLYIVTSAANIDMVADTSIRKTLNWELVKVGMPSWAGMTSWGNPVQLAAWGDTNAAALVSMAVADDPWNWVANQDVQFGADKYDPVIGMLGYKGGLLGFKKNSMTGWNGSALEDISSGDGLIARDALVADNQQAYWLDIDGPKKIALGDFRGYTITKIGEALNPVFNTWSSGFFGTSVVPFSINPAYRNRAILRYNEWDEHLYLSFAADSSTTNNRTLTYSVPRQEWDGVFTIGMSDAMPFVWKDTSCLVYTRNDTAIIMRTGQAFNDNGVGIASDLRSGRFWLVDQDGWPLVATLGRVRFAGRGAELLFDTMYVSVYANRGVSGGEVGSASDSVHLDISQSVADGYFTWNPSGDLSGTYWEWRVYVDGNSTGSLFSPHELLLEFTPVGREK